MRSLTGFAAVAPAGSLLLAGAPRWMPCRTSGEPAAELGQW